MSSKPAEQVDSKVLGQLMLMQSFVVTLPDEDTIFSFVCKGLLDIPGVVNAEYEDNQKKISSHDSNRMYIPIHVDDAYYGNINLTLSDIDRFQPYRDFLSNFIFMIGVILEQKQQRKLILKHKLQLEQKVKERTEQLKNEKQLLQSIIDTIPVMVTIYDREVNSVFLNNAVERVTGWNNEDAQENNIMKLIYPDPVYRDQVSEFMQVLEPEFRDIIMRTKDGRDIETSWANVEIPDGRNVGVGVDISERKEMERELVRARKNAEESEKQLRLILDNFVNGMVYQVAMLDENRRQFNYLSKNVEELYGCTAEDAKKDANLIYSKIHPDDIEGLIEKEKKALKEMSVFEAEARTLNPNGNIRWAYYISKPRIINGVVCWDGIEIDITERKQMELELIKAKEKAEEADRLKSAFLANMSHEVRIPMNGILGFTNLLQEHDLTGEQRQQYIEIIRKSGDRMLNTVNDIIEISKIETGQIKISTTIVNISNHLETLHEFFNLEANNKGLKLILNNKLSKDEFFIITDKNKLNSILTNLIKNALKFTKKGVIKIGCKRKDDLLEFYVKDTGIGIPFARREAIFNRFEQADVDDKLVHEGSGLGLAIVKSYVEMLGGNVWVESEENKGSTFFFTISYHPAKSEIQDESNIDNVISDK